MIRWCLREDHGFGVVLSQEGTLAEVGCLAKIEEVARRYEDGRMDLITEGEARFAVAELFNDRPYLTATVKPREDREEPKDRLLQERVISIHLRLLELAGRTVSPTLYQNRTYISFFVAHNAGLSLDQKQAVLEMRSENQRLSFLADHLKVFVQKVEKAESFRKKVQSNGHFKDFPPED